MSVGGPRPTPSTLLAESDGRANSACVPRTVLSAQNDPRLVWTRYRGVVHRVVGFDERGHAVARCGRRRSEGDLLLTRPSGEVCPSCDE